MIAYSKPLLATAALAMVIGMSGSPAFAQETGIVVDEVPPVSEFPEEEIDPNVSGLQPVFAPVDGVLPDIDGRSHTNEFPSDLEDTGTEADLTDEPEYIQQPAVLLRGLDKISGRSTDIDLAVDENIMFGGLRVSVKACHQTPPTEAPESIAYIEVEDYGFSVEDYEALPDEIDKKNRVFHGWMFASSPGINGLEHPIYDVWVIRCMAEAPVRSETGSES